MSKKIYLHPQGSSSERIGCRVVCGKTILLMKVRLQKGIIKRRQGKKIQANRKPMAYVKRQCRTAH